MSIINILTAVSLKDPSRNPSKDAKILDHMPSIPNPNFMGREEDLNCLKQFLGPLERTSQRIAVVYATGGMGKTELAAEYAHRHRHEFSLIFWVIAASRETMTAAFRDAAQRMVNHCARARSPPVDYTQIGSELDILGLINTDGQVSDKPGDGGRVVVAVKSWLVGRGEYLIIFDGYDDLESFHIEDFIPISSSGRIIITSRRPESRDLGSYHMELGEMDEDSSVALFIKVSGSDNETGEGVVDNW
jgi:hypothetical protein